MKAKAACIGTPPEMVDYFSSSKFARGLLVAVVGRKLGVSDVLSRPAEYYVQHADQGSSTNPEKGIMGVEVRLTGVSRGNRKSTQFQDASDTLHKLVEIGVKKTLPKGQRCQVFTVIMCDQDVEVTPGQFNATIEHLATWVDGEAESTSS